MKNAAKLREMAKGQKCFNCGSLFMIVILAARGIYPWNVNSVFRLPSLKLIESQYCKAIK